MHRVTRFLLVSALIGVGLGADAQGELTPRERAADAAVGVFFDKPSAAASATPRDASDDARVDRWLARCARMAAGRPVLQAAVYRRLIDRAAASRRGQGRALGYQLALCRAQPRHRWCGAVYMAQRYRLAYEQADRDERTAMAEPFIGELLVLIQGHESSWEIDAALALHREASAVARSARSPYRLVLDDYGRALNELRREAQRFESLRGQVEAGSASAPAARALAVRLAVERQAFDEAVSAATVSGDTALVGWLEQAARPADTLAPDQSLALADGYLALADDPALTLDRARLLALQEAQFYFNHYLFLAPGQDVTRLRVVQATEALAGRIAELRPEPIRRPAGPWRDLIAGIAEATTGDRGNLVRGRHLRVGPNRVYTHDSSFTVPVQAEGGYDLRMGIARTHANNRAGMALYFPIGASQGGRLVLGAGGDDSCRIQGLPPIQRLANFQFPEDRPVAMVLAVRPGGGGKVHLVLALDGVTMLDWTGPLSELRVNNNERPPGRQGNILRIDAGTTYEFQQIEARRAAEE